MTRYSKQIYPAKVQPLAGATGYPASGYFAMHITYPDTDYDDDITTWQYAANSNNWKQGLTVLIRTNLATSSAPAEADNVIVVDLKAQDAAGPGDYNLGTEEATRYIAAKINSRKVKQVASGGTRYLRARYVRMSGRPTYSGNALIALTANSMRLQFDGGYRNGYPSDLPTTGTISYTDGDHTNLTLNYTNIAPVRLGPTRIGQYVNTSDSVADFTITESLSSSLTQVASNGSTLPNDILSNATFTIAGEPPKHTIVLTWEQRTPNSAGGYWAEANAGPIIQGLGQSVPTWLLAAKPLDGGNMGLPAPGFDSKGSTAVAHSTGHGYVRFSIEGLNSCDLPDIPPPDFTVTSPSLRGVTKSDFATTGSSNVKMADLEYGTKLSTTSGDKLHTSHGYQATAGTSTNIVKHSNDELTSISYVGDFVSQGLKYDNTKYAPRPIFTAKTLNTETKVRGLQISNENMVFDDLETKDDQGNILTLFGGSPWGVVIRDYKLQNTREDPITGEEVTGPSTTDGRLIPNMEIQLPDPEEIPGGVFVRTGHDRVQAWSNMTWGLGGLAPPDPRKPGVSEASGVASQFDTHDRMLIFHVQRVLHGDLSGKHGLTPHTTPGAVPSGSTRLFSAHRITDHAERGSVLTQTNNGNPSGNTYPHHRIRFGRQGHSYVTPLMHRGTPAAMRRQLHRSHGSAYSLLFEAETEHKHTLFGSGKDTSSNTVFELDTLDTKGQTGYLDSTGSFASDGIPLDEIKGFRLPDVKTTYNSVTPRDDLDYLIAPGQQHTKTVGVGHTVRRATPSENASFSVAGPTRLTFANALPSADRYNSASEASINGILLGDYLLGGGTPMPALIYEGSSSYFVSGREEGVSVSRISTEIATTPPLLCHDPEYMNLGARTAGGGGITAANADLGLMTDSNTGTGAKPDAFLCNWLAEYSHPAFFGTVREHFLTFRYREAGMPRSLNYPPVRGLYLRNHSNPTTTAQAENADAIEKLYVGQWLQNYGYNGLNAGGHGTTQGLRGANSVLMGHTTVREAHGTLRLLKQYENIRYSRGEGIGDGINPERTGATIFYDSDSDSVSFTKYVTVLDSMVAYDMSRRMPIRAYGIRTASDSLDMLAGDPNEGSNAEAVYGKGRFDGGIHDSVQKMPNTTDHGSAWFFDQDYSGVERSIPIGLVMSSHTAESSPYSSTIRRSNLPINSSESPIGIGSTLGLESGGMTLPTSMPAGLWENEFIEAPLKARPHNKGSDPFIDLYQYTGSDSYNQSQSIAAVERSNTFGVSGTFYHLRGNSLHTNASALDHSSKRPTAASNGVKKTHYPTTGWGIASYNSSTNATKTLKAIPLSEISDHRQVQSRTEPRLGLIIDTENERLNNKTMEYQVIGTKAFSLNTDLGVGQHYPITPSWVSKTKLEKDGFTINGGAGSTVTHSNEYVAPTWSPDSDDAKGLGGSAISGITLSNAGTGYTAGTLSATGGGGSGFAGTYTISAAVSNTVSKSGGGGEFAANQTSGSITVNNSGTNGSGFAATFVTTSDGSSVSSVSIGSAGSKFNFASKALTVNHGSNNGSGFAATAFIGQPRACTASNLNGLNAMRITGGPVTEGLGSFTGSSWRLKVSGTKGTTANHFPSSVTAQDAFFALTFNSSGILTGVSTAAAGSGFQSNMTITHELQWDPSGGSSYQTYGDSGDPSDGFFTYGTGATLSSQNNNANSGTLTQIQVTNFGSGYTGSFPTITLTHNFPPVTGQTNALIGRTLNAATRSLGTITVTNQGSGYTSAPALSITSPAVFTGTLTASLLSTGPVHSVTMTNGGSGYTSEPTIVFSNPGSNATVSVSLPATQDEPRIHANTHALDAWAVRGSADLPPWGGVYILRKTYLNRTEEGSLSTSIFGTGGNAMPSHPRRKAVDYIVRPVRPLKLYAFASSLMGDGWTNGPRCASDNSNSLAYQPFTRDARYGLFEINVDEGLGTSSFVGSPEGAFIMDFPDANEFDVVYHLIPSASMLQFFKSDAARRSADGTYNPEIEPRYSQTLHPGGGEALHQSQVRYKIDGSGIGGDFAKHGLEDEVTHTTHEAMMRLFPSFEVKSHYQVSSTVYVVLDDASILPSSGKMFISGVSGALTYSAKSGDKLTLSANAITGYTSVGSLVGKKLHFTDVASPSSINDFRAVTLPYPTIPTFADNALVMAKIESDSWRRYDSDTDTVKDTALSYRGLLEYDPSDFIMLSQQPLKITNSKNIVEIKNIRTSIQKIRVDSKEITETYNPPYLIDSDGNRLRVAGTKIEAATTSLVFKNIESDSLSDEGINTEKGILLGQYGFIGVRTSDAALMMLDDAGPELTSFNVTPTNALVANDRDISSTLKAHPSLRIINDHSRTFVARKTRGISVLEVIRNLTNLDGRQLVNEKNGGLVYGSTTFNDRGTTIGMSTAAKEVGISRMIDSPNEVIVVGDRIAINEQVYVAINDPERMKNEAGAGATTGLAKTLRQDIAGLKTKQEAVKLAKSVLARTENRSPIISIKGALKMTSVNPGEMVTVDLPVHNLRGRFAVFEAEHNFATLESDFVIAQYDKGIEGILSDLRAFTSNSAPADESASDIVDVVEMSTSGAIRIQAVHRVQVRSVNNRGFIIGAKQGKGMGKIGVRTGNKRSLPIGHSKSRYYVVK